MVTAGLMGTLGSPGVFQLLLFLGFLAQWPGGENGFAFSTKWFGLIIIHALPITRSEAPGTGPGTVTKF